MRIPIPIRTSVVLTLAALVSVAPPLSGQGILDAMKQRAKQKAAEQVAKRGEQAVDSAFSKTGNAIKCAVSDAACIQKAKNAGQTPVLTDASGKPLPDQAGAQQAAGSGSAAVNPLEGVAANFDFTPGERVLFAEDFAKDNVGDFPRRLEFVKGNMEVVEWRGARWLRGTTSGRFDIPLPEVLPERFTVEFEHVGNASSWPQVTLRFDGDDQDTQATDRVVFKLWAGSREQSAGGVQAKSGMMKAEGTTPTLANTPFPARIMVDGRYVKVYMAGARVANVPNANLGRGKKIIVEYAASAEEPAFFRNIRVAAGGRKLAESLAASGRVATQGIYFDTGSDRIRPESAPTLKEIAAVLREDPALKLTIEGHTDNAGGAQQNQALSEKRAAAVKAALVGSYGVDATRLATKGLGASKPVASNDTPEGRQQNRRVELVKM